MKYTATLQIDTDAAWTIEADRKLRDRLLDHANGLLNDPRGKEYTLPVGKVGLEIFSTTEDGGKGLSVINVGIPYNQKKAQEVADWVNELRPAWDANDEFQAVVSVYPDPADKNSLYFWFGDANETYNGDIMTGPEESSRGSVDTKLNADAATPKELAEAIVAKVEGVLDFERRLPQIMEDAQINFWESVVKGVPESTAGDFSPTDQDELDKAMEQAVRVWVMTNTEIY